MSVEDFVVVVDVDVADEPGTKGIAGMDTKSLTGLLRFTTITAEGVQAVVAVAVVAAAKRGMGGLAVISAAAAGGGSNEGCGDAGDLDLAATRGGGLRATPR